MQKALLIHVGADQSDWSTLGVNAPIFDDDTFEFIPIPDFLVDGTCIVKRGRRYVAVREGREQGDEIWTSERRTYSIIETRNKVFGKTLSDYLPQEYDHMIVHYDPDFDHYTYGDRVDVSKGMQIQSLGSTDYIFFVASLASYTKEAYRIRSANRIRSFQRGKMAKFIIGYFKVQEVYYAIKAFDELTPRLFIPFGDNEPVNDEIDGNTLIRIRNNAHTKRDEDVYYIVVGDPSDSSLLTRPIRLTERGSPFKPSGIGREIFGDVSYPRGVKWIHDPKRIRVLLNYIREEK